MARDGGLGSVSALIEAERRILEAERTCNEAAEDCARYELLAGQALQNGDPHQVMIDRLLAFQNAVKAHRDAVNKQNLVIHSYFRLSSSLCSVSPLVTPNQISQSTSTQTTGTQDIGTQTTHTGLVGLVSTEELRAPMKAYPFEDPAEAPAEVDSEILSEVESEVEAEVEPEVAAQVEEGREIMHIADSDDLRLGDLNRVHEEQDDQLVEDGGFESPDEVEASSYYDDEEGSQHDDNEGSNYSDDDDDDVLRRMDRIIDAKLDKAYEASNGALSRVQDDSGQEGGEASKRADDTTKHAKDNRNNTGDIDGDDSPVPRIGKRKRTVMSPSPSRAPATKKPNKACKSTPKSTLSTQRLKELRETN